MLHISLFEVEKQAVAKYLPVTTGVVTDQEPSNGKYAPDNGEVNVFLPPER